MNRGQRNELKELVAKTGLGQQVVPPKVVFDLRDSLRLRGPLKVWVDLLAWWASRPDLHDSEIGLGVALRRIVKEDRLLYLLNATGWVLEDAVSSIARRLSSSKIPYNFQQLAALTFDSGNPTGDRLRLNIAADYHRAS